MKKIKVAHILHSVGGVDVSLRQIIQNLDASAFECFVIHGDKETNEEFRDKSKKRVVDYKIPIYRPISIKNDFLAIIKALKIVRKESPDIIHSHSTKGGVIGRVVGFLTGIKVLHTPQAFSYLSTNNKIKKAFFLIVEKILSKGNTILLASSESELNRAIEEVGFSETKTLLFSNAIEPIENILELSIPRTWPEDYFCTVGRPCYQKNIEELIRVLHEVNKTLQMHLVLVGVGYHADQLEEVQKLVSKLDLINNVTLLNWTSREDVLNIVSQSKLYLSTARYEGLPYAIIESLALSIPCVVSNCDGNRDLIKNDFNGYVVEDDDTVVFAQRIIKLLNDENTYIEFSKNAKIRFEMNHNILKEIHDLEFIYREQIK
ncbi:glycosyltransferase [Flavobacterium poyangense]|uniref:glycosyltransferase n=1 Tax=Flavobacterium poyangense TaxID=2204302 RepID=UPI0014202F69|nr:glycosyltransferase [Flavobacterium sp. JXAS1]